MYRDLLDGEWSYEEWRQLHLHRWVERCESTPASNQSAVKQPISKAAKQLCLAPLQPLVVLACLCLLVLCCRGQLLLEQPDWDFSEFMSQHLPAYLVMTQEFMQECFSQQQQQQQQQQQ
jgi:hypothetical protein